MKRARLAIFLPATALLAATSALLLTSGAAALGPAPRVDPLMSPSRESFAPSPPMLGGMPPRAQPKRADPQREPGQLPPANEALQPGVAAYKQRGVALGMFSEDVSFSYAALLREIAALGATHVALIVPIYQTNGRTTDLAMHTRYSPTLALLADTVRAARREQLEVTVFPIVRLSDPAPGEWRGTLAPKNVHEWFKHYSDVLGDLAAVAAQTGATRLVIGSELSTLDGKLDEWRPVIERVRGLFSGHLVYSSNWDHYRDARLFDLVDEDGVVAYFRLREDAKAAFDVAALESSWRRVQSEIEQWHRDSTHPLVFTEVGYRSRVGSTISPWDETPGGVPDMEEQRRAFAAFHRVWARSPYLDGAYIWNWYGWGGPQSHGYTPRGKPAAEEIRGLLQDL